MTQIVPNYAKTVKFLDIFAPKGPHLLCSMRLEGGGLESQYFESTDGVPEWCQASNKGHGLYYHVGTPRSGVETRMAKGDVACLRWLWVDVDPAKHAPISEERARIYGLLVGAPPQGVPARPNILVDSGGGYQALWELQQPLRLDNPEDITEAERITRWLVAAYGGDPHAWEVARVLRLPGSVNYPDQRKINMGREPALSTFEVLETTAVLAEDFAKAPPMDDDENASVLVEVDVDGFQPRKLEDLSSLDDKWQSLIECGEESFYFEDSGYPSRSEAVMGAARYMLERGMPDQKVFDILMTPEFALSAHVLEQPQPARSALRAIRHCKERMNEAKEERANITADAEWIMTPAALYKDGTTRTPPRINIHKIHNQRLALLKMGAQCRHDLMSGKLLVNDEELESHVITGLRMDIENEFDLTFPARPIEEVLEKMCREGPFHPVREYLDGLPKWDGKPRLDTWLMDYCGAVSETDGDMALLRSYGRATLIAAVSRVYRPGCKFDTMLVLEGDQGCGKSSVISALVPNPSWFSDQLPLDASSKVFLEQITGHWIIECAEMDGIRAANVNKLKTLLSTRADRARRAYARSREDRLRDCIFIGSTNRTEYLQDETGNRRFWPVRCEGNLMKSLPKLRQNRTQLWAEAVSAHRSGESIQLDPSLYHLSDERTGDRRENPSLLDLFDDALGAEEGWVRICDLLEFIGIPVAQHESHNRTAGRMLRQLGFRKRQKKEDGIRRYRWQRGESKDEILLIRDKSEAM